MDTIQQEIEQEEQLNQIDDTNVKINPYQELIVNNAERVDPFMTQMEQWSILRNVLNYVQHARYYTSNQTIDIKTVDKHKNTLGTSREEESVELNFESTPIKPCKDYLNVYEGIQSEIVNTSRFNENSDLSMTYLGRSDKAIVNKLRWKSHFQFQSMGIQQVDF